ncbi:MAG TPA: hypothetical protein VF135_07225 [Terriglobales bacterium]
MRNQTASKLDLTKSRQTLVDGLSQNATVKSSGWTIIPIEVADSDDAQDAIFQQKCEFAVYARFVVPRPAEVRPLYPDTMVYRDKPPADKELIGLQCTVERSGYRVPVLIDREYMKFPGSAEKGAEKLVTAEVQKVVEAIGKKMASTPK